MVEFNIIVQANLQQALVITYISKGNGFLSFLFKFYLNAIHTWFSWGAKVFQNAYLTNRVTEKFVPAPLISVFYLNLAQPSIKAPIFSKAACLSLGA